MIRVLDEQRSVGFYRLALGLAVADRLDFPTFTRIYLSHLDSGFELDLTVNKCRTDPYDLGDGYLRRRAKPYRSRDRASPSVLQSPCDGFARYGTDPRLVSPMAQLDGRPVRSDHFDPG